MLRRKEVEKGKQQLESLKTSSALKIVLLTRLAADAMIDQKR